MLATGLSVKMPVGKTIGSRGYKGILVSLECNTSMFLFLLREVIGLTATVSVGHSTDLLLVEFQFATIGNGC